MSILWFCIDKCENDKMELNDRFECQLNIEKSRMDIHIK